MATIGIPAALVHNLHFARPPGIAFFLMYLVHSHTFYLMTLSADSNCRQNKHISSQSIAPFHPSHPPHPSSSPSLFSFLPFYFAPSTCLFIHPVHRILYALPAPTDEIVALIKISVTAAINLRHRHRHRHCQASTDGALLTSPCAFYSARANWSWLKRQCQIPNAEC